MGAFASSHVLRFQMSRNDQLNSNLIVHLLKMIYMKGDQKRQLPIKISKL